MMQDPTVNIGVALKRVRFERGLTLDETSRITGVSKAMLGQIERGESNPTISILWKISTGLRISFSEMLSGKSEDYKIINIKGVEPLIEVNGEMKLYDVFSFDPISGFEYFFIEMNPGAVRYSDPHTSLSEEYIVVTEGTLTMIIDEKIFELKAPSAIKFKADVSHTYENRGSEKVVFQNIIKY